MIFTETELAGAYTVELKRIEDDRGFFARAWCVDEFAAHGLAIDLAQMNVARNNRRGILRGLHYQRPPDTECKLIRCTRGAVYNVIVDLRKESPTFCDWFGMELSADNHAMIYSPVGFANGYQTLTDDAEICYQTTKRYAPDAATGIRFDDPAFGIAWPLDVTGTSPADASWPDFDAANDGMSASDLRGGAS